MMETNNTTLIEVDKGIKVVPGANTIVTTLDKFINSGRNSSI